MVTKLQEKLRSRQGGVVGTTDFLSEDNSCNLGVLSAPDEAGSGGNAGQKDDLLQIVHLQAETIESQFFDS